MKELGLVKVGACITTYRESALGLLVKLQQIGFLVFIVDAEETGVRRGIGPCLMDAWRMALDAGCDYIVQLDAGGSHDPDQAGDFLLPLYYGNSDLVIGSRFCNGGEYIGNTKRKLMSRAAALMCNLAQAGARYSDWTSGYRGFTASAAAKLLKPCYSSQMHFWQAEVLAMAGEMGLRIVEVPITYRAGRSSFNASVAWEAFCGWTHIIHHVGGVRRT